MVKYIQNYALYEIIGSGVYGKVYRAINNQDRKQYAVKVIPIAKFRQNKKLQECTVNEINILSNIQNNQHIIRYFDMLKTTNNFYFIYEFCNGGTLEGLLSKQKKLPEPKALLILKELLQAFQILNKYNIMHRDMKPDNIFFHNGVIKLGDFGFCKNLNSADQMTKTMLGSPIYMAPQVLKGQIYSNKADIWSLGVVLYEMLFGHCPYQSNSIANLIEVLNTQTLAFPGQITPYLKNIISRMLTKDPVQRIGWMQIFQIKINNEGYIDEGKQNNKISSLSDAKVSDQNTTLSNSSKFLPNNSVSSKNQSYTVINDDSQNGNRGFKKNRNQVQVTETNNGNISLNGNGSMNINTSSNGNNLNSTNNLNSNNANRQQGKDSQIKLVSEEHKNIIQGVKLSMDLVQSKIPNSSGYAFLVLNRAGNTAGELLSKVSKREIAMLLQKQVKDIKIEKDAISSKMFPYELKGLDDWKKYLRGKFFQEQKTIGIWYKMVLYLNGSRAAQNQNYKSMTDTVKSILY